MYQARLRVGDSSNVGQGKTDHQAITAALADSKIARDANPYAVAVAVSYVYANGSQVLYATTLGKYQQDIEG